MMIDATICGKARYAPVSASSTFGEVRITRELVLNVDLL